MNAHTCTVCIAVVYNIHVYIYITVTVPLCRVVEIETMLGEMAQLKQDQMRDEVPFSPAGLLFSDQDM